MTTITVKMSNPKILHVVESYENGKRYRWTLTRWTKSDGNYHIDTHCEEVADVGPLLFIPEGPDVDAQAVHDLTQMAKLKPRKPREKPDIVKLYDEFRYRRGEELKDIRVYPVAKVE